ncbi:hypothetical protein M8C21_001463, partial [Ambrosia artemisiifolia]
PSSPLGEGSWNVAWDMRPARWLHRPHTAWLLFGVCAYLAPPPVDFMDVVTNSVDANDDCIDGICTTSVLNSASYRVTGVPADGRCLFRAIAHMVCLRKGEDAPDENRQKELADELRVQVVDELVKRRKEIECKNPRRLAAVVMPPSSHKRHRFDSRKCGRVCCVHTALRVHHRRCYRSRQLPMPEGNAIGKRGGCGGGSGGGSGGDFDAYVKRIQKPFSWGGEPELLMASHVLKTTISVYTFERGSINLSKIATYGEKYEQDEISPIKVLFHGYGHYDILEDMF